MVKYSPNKIEKKWQKRWEKERVFVVAENSKKKKFYCLDMFPYPSGQGLHVGHPEGYTASDIIVRKRLMEGWNVLHPMGWDAFGLPAENYAIKSGVHPNESTQKNIKTFRRQIKSLGLAYDWSREVDTSSPEYYRWTQRLFLLFYKNGLAYRAKAPVNWCLSCKTVLANEQVVDGKCERCKNDVVQKDLEQWFFRITEYADRLLADLRELDWPEKIKDMQKNWIGRSEGTIINFRGVRTKEQKNKRTKEQSEQTVHEFFSSSVLLSEEHDIPVFTTRPDTIFGVSYLVLAPEHPLVQELVSDGEREKVAMYIKETFKKTERERTGFDNDPSTGQRAGKTGVFLGASAVNPLTGEKVPIWIADYVLARYGTGAVMGVPAHDERDFSFARKYGLDVKYVIAPPHETSEKQQATSNKAYTDEGYLVNSGEFSGLTSENARQKIASHLESKGLGSRQTNYHLRDWLVSRQRYWGAPIPIIYCANCAIDYRKSEIRNPKSEKNEELLDVATIDGVEYAIVPVPEKDLPVKLPKDVDFKPTGESPLTQSKSFHNVKCPTCGKKARRESDTMDTFVDSSWYFLRYCDPRSVPEAPEVLRAQHAFRAHEFLDPKKISYWCPVDLYVGGAEHAVMHLLYARFFTKVLYDLKHISFNEPFLKLKNQGLIMGEDGQKMSKSRGNVINPDDVVKEYGADTLRMYEMFMGAFEDAKPWSTGSIKGVRRFLDRVWTLQGKVSTTSVPEAPAGASGTTSAALLAHKNQDLERLLHKTIKKVTEDIEGFRFNTAISAMMILSNAMLDSLLEESEAPVVPEAPEVLRAQRATLRTRWGLPQEWYEQLVLLLSPFAPHMCEEIWERLGHKNSIIKELWPNYDEALTKDNEITLVIQINGKVRDTIRVSATISEEEARAYALQSSSIQKYLTNHIIRKVVFVPQKLLNFVLD